ncbi:MAG: GntR family transcriptional regulator [Firmicutes bacterium]|nr:GntR family transcriptional regulator [Bacillota bacterium]
MFSIDYRSDKPLYQQLVDNIERLTLCGVLAPESRLPSVRALAGELSINPNTIQKAYTELESRGVIFTLPGKGAFICQESGKLLHKKRLEVLEQLFDTTAEACRLHIPQEDVIACCHRAYEETADKGGERK